MRIDSNIPTDFAVEAGRSAKNGQTTATRTADSNELAKVDTTALSAAQDQVGTLISELQNLPEVRQGKVNALQTAIQRGEYKIAPEQIAAALYRDMASLTGSSADVGINAGY
jgi:negative regulator of flagellin synthesis FlgM